MARLPTPGQDDGTWGDLLNDYLLQAHTTAGALKPDAVTASSLQDSSVASATLQDGAVTAPKLSPTGGTTGEVLVRDTGISGGMKWDTVGGGAPSGPAGGDLAGTYPNPTVPGLGTKEPLITAGTTTQYYRGDKSFQTLDKAAVGLANVDNTSDANKPVSTATTTALAGKANTTTTISAGTGLTGGGDLSANRTISANFGVAAGTIAQGNDSRITGAEQSANKGVANGYASLNASIRVPTAQLGSGTADTTTYLRGDGAWSAPSGGVTPINGGGETYFDAGTSGAAKTLDLANGNVQKLTLTANCTLTLTGPASGAYRSLMVYVFQDGTGDRLVTWPASVKWGTSGPPVLSTAGTKMDKILLDTVDGGTTWYGSAGPGGY